MLKSKVIFIVILFIEAALSNPNKLDILYPADGDSIEAGVDFTITWRCLVEKDLSYYAQVVKEGAKVACKKNITPDTTWTLKFPDYPQDSPGWYTCIVCAVKPGSRYQCIEGCADTVRFYNSGSIIESPDSMWVVFKLDPFEYTIFPDPEDSIKYVWIDTTAVLSWSFETNENWWFPDAQSYDIKIFANDTLLAEFFDTKDLEYAGGFPANSVIEVVGGVIWRKNRYRDYYAPSDTFKFKTTAAPLSDGSPSDMWMHMSRPYKWLDFKHNKKKYFYEGDTVEATAAISWYVTTSSKYEKCSDIEANFLIISNGDTIRRFQDTGNNGAFSQFPYDSSVEVVGWFSYHGHVYTEGRARVSFHTERAPEYPINLWFRFTYPERRDTGPYHTDTVIKWKVTAESPVIDSLFTKHVRILADGDTIVKLDGGKELRSYPGGLPPGKRIEAVGWCTYKDSVYNEDRLIFTTWNLAGVSQPTQTPTSFELEQNFPNPFNPTTSIQYALPNAGAVRLTVFNTTGQQVKTLVNENQTTGTYTVVWDATDQRGIRVPSGMYIYRIEAGEHRETRRMLLLK